MALKPILVGFGSLYPELKEIREIIQLLNQAGRDFPIIVGGQMVSPTPEFAVKITGADFGAIGEAEITLHQLVRVLREGRDPGEVKGLVIRQSEDCILTGPGEYFHDLTNLPPIPYELFPTEHWLPIGLFYAQHAPQPHWHLEDRVINVHGGRGCPFQCNFCYHHSKPRYRPIPVMMAEAAEALERFNGNMLYFSDDLVLANQKRAKELISHIRSLKRRIEFSVSTRFDLLARMDDALLSELKAVGCRIMGLGVESGSNRILKVIGKNCTAEMILTQLERLKRVGILPSVSIMVGQYTETLEDVEDSISLMRESVRNNTNINYYFSATTPFPGTKLYKLAFEKGLLHDDQHFYDLFFSSGDEFQQVVNLSSMSMQEVREQLQRIWRIYGEEKNKAPTRQVYTLSRISPNFTQMYDLPFEIDCLMLDWNESVLLRCKQKNINWQMVVQYLQGPLFQDLLNLSLNTFPQLKNRWTKEKIFNVSPFSRKDLPSLIEDNVDVSHWFVIYTGDYVNGLASVDMAENGLSKQLIEFGRSNCNPLDS